MVGFSKRNVQSAAVIAPPTLNDISASVCGERKMHKTGILVRRYAIAFKKEIFRKSIHLCTLAVPFALSLYFYPTIIALAAVLLCYIAAEFCRMRGVNVPIISAVTAAAARKRDENRFVLGPVTLCLGVIVSALCFNPVAAAIGIYALGAGDGLASLTGKMFGRLKIPFTGGKSVVGSLTCFLVIFVAAAAVSKNAYASLAIAACGMFIEMLPLKDFDNVLIPVSLAALSQFVFGF